MTLSEELTWRGFVNQTTYKDIKALDGQPIRFYWGVDPSADSMQVGNLAMAMMVKLFMKHGHIPYLLVGGATGMIGDPDGKSSERELKPLEEIAHNKAAIAEQYKRVFDGLDFTIVDNYDWFKDMGYLDFLRLAGKHAPMRQMLAREFVQTRLREEGDGISYAEFSYSLIQGYDFLYQYQNYGVTLQVAGSDQWGNCIAGVELIRRIEGKEANIWTGPIILNSSTGKKFGKTEEGAIWLDPKKTSPTQFYQFWMTVDDAGAEQYLKVYTDETPETINNIMSVHRELPEKRAAQRLLAEKVTTLVHGKQSCVDAQSVTDILIDPSKLGEASTEIITLLRSEQPATTSAPSGGIIEALVSTGLASSNTEARRLLAANAVSINGDKVTREQFIPDDFISGRLLLRRGKAFKDSAFVEIST